MVPRQFRTTHRKQKEAHKRRDETKESKGKAIDDRAGGRSLPKVLHQPNMMPVIKVREGGTGTSDGLCLL